MEARRFFRVEQQEPLEVDGGDGRRRVAVVSNDDIRGHLWTEIPGWHWCMTGGGHRGLHAGHRERPRHLHLDLLWHVRSVVINHNFQPNQPPVSDPLDGSLTLQL